MGTSRRLGTVEDGVAGRACSARDRQMEQRDRLLERAKLIAEIYAGKWDITPWNKRY
jgi:hypothetical protein